MFGLLLFGILLSMVLPLALPFIFLAALSGVVALLVKLVMAGGGGFLTGIAIGLLLYSMIRRNSAEKKAATRRNEAREGSIQEARVNETVTESETLVEPTVSRYNGTGCGY